MSEEFSAPPLCHLEVLWWDKNQEVGNEILCVCVRVCVVQYMCVTLELAASPPCENLSGCGFGSVPEYFPL